MEDLKAGLTLAETECREEATVVLAKAERLKLVQQTLPGDTKPNFYVVRLGAQLNEEEMIPVGDIKVPTLKDNYPGFRNRFRKYSCDAVKIGKQQEKGGLELVLKTKTKESSFLEDGEGDNSHNSNSDKGVSGQRPYKRKEVDDKKGEGLGKRCKSDLECNSGFCYWSGNRLAKRRCRCVKVSGSNKSGESENKKTDQKGKKHDCITIEMDVTEGESCHRDWQCRPKLYCVSKDLPEPEEGKQFKRGKCKKVPEAVPKKSFTSRVAKTFKRLTSRTSNNKAKEDGWEDLKLDCRDVIGTEVKQESSKYCVVRSTWLSRAGQNWMNAAWRDANFQGLLPVNDKAFYDEKTDLKSKLDLPDYHSHRKWLTLQSAYLSQERGTAARRNYHMLKHLGRRRGATANFKTRPGDGLNWHNSKIGDGIPEGETIVESSKLGFCQPCYERLCEFARKIKAAKQNRKFATETARFAKYSANVDIASKIGTSIADNVIDHHKNSYSKAFSKAKGAKAKYEQIKEHRKHEEALINKKGRYEGMTTEKEKTEKYKDQERLRKLSKDEFGAKTLMKSKNGALKTKGEKDLNQLAQFTDGLANKLQISEADKLKAYMDLAIKFSSCAAGIGMAAGTAGVTAGGAAKGCIVFLAAAAKHVVESMKDAVIIMPDPPLFASELEWTKEYVEAVENKLKDESAAQGMTAEETLAAEAEKKVEQVLAETTLRQLICVVQRMTEYTTDPGNRGGASEQGVTKIKDVQLYQEMERKATETLRELQRKMVTILQVKLVDTTMNIRDKADKNFKLLGEKQ
eukprot:g6099.t1